MIEEAQARGDPASAAQARVNLRRRYDEAVAFGITHNHRDWHDGDHPGYALVTWLRDYAPQMWLFTLEVSVDWTNNVSERGAKAAKRHQAVSGYWQSHATLQRWCRLRSYLGSALAHGLTALDAITRALEGNPWLPPFDGRRASGGMKPSGPSLGSAIRLAVRERWPATRLSSSRRFPGRAGELAPGAHHKHNCQDPEDGRPYQSPVKMGREDGADCPCQSQGPGPASQGANAAKYRHQAECVSKCDTDRKRPR
jgi:hypothetical protein